MNCTSCKNGTLAPNYLDGTLPCFRCSNCQGSFISLPDYCKWRDHREKPLAGVDTPAKVQAQETSKAIICPKSGKLMIKYRISKNTDHRLDLSPSINAIWMDDGEWELLKENQLSGNLNDIFTDHWQRKIQAERSSEILSQRYQQLFGDKYTMIKKFREDIRSLPEKAEIIAYLLADD